MARPRTPIGTFGEIEFTHLATGGVRARVRFRDSDGQLRRVESAAGTCKVAEHAEGFKIGIKPSDAEAFWTFLIDRHQGEEWPRPVGWGLEDFTDPPDSHSEK